MHLRRLEHVGEHALTERSHQPGQLAGPAPHYIAIDIHAPTPQDPGLAVPGLMINKAADDQMCEQCTARHHLGQRQIDDGRLSDRLARPASDTRTNMAQDAEPGRHVIQHFGDIFANDGSDAAAGTGLRAMLRRQARYMRRYRRPGSRLAC